mgnify:FL=1
MHQLWCELAALTARIIVAFSIPMNKLVDTTLFISTLLSLLGCGSPGPTPEQQAKDAAQEREAQRQQAEFRKGLPPVSNPGQGW